MYMIRWNVARDAVCGLIAAIAVGSTCPFRAVNAQRLAAAEEVARDTVTLTMLARPVTVRLDAVPLKHALDALASQARVNIGYRGPLVDAVTAPVTLHATRLPLGDALDRVLRGTGLQAVPFAREQISIEPSIRERIVQGAITGVVTNAKTKQPVVGATVLLDDATSGVVTSDDGRFRLSVRVGEHRITVRALGFVRQTSQVTVREGEAASLMLTLAPSASVLDEVVVTGTVVATERKAIPTPITVISAADIEKQGITRIDQLFRGQVPGVVALEPGIQRYDGTSLGSMATTQVYTRGSSSLIGGANPLKTYIDGVEILDPSYVGTIDPKSIDKIEIITGPQAATIYGSGAMGGVMQIFTKKGAGHVTPNVTISAKYGMLQSSLSSGKAPTHTDAVSVSGGTGPTMTYSLNASYGYSGQWQPLLFNRTYGVQVGVSHREGGFSASGSASVTRGTNGTAYGTASPYFAKGFQEGKWGLSSSANLLQRQTRSNSASHTIGISADYTVSSLWQHHLTIGLSQTAFALVPRAPIFSAVTDTLFSHSSSTGNRTSASYNTTVIPRAVGPFSLTLTLGATGSSGQSTISAGSTLSSSASSWSSPIVYSAPADKNYGGFSSARLGVADRLFITASLRGEHNPSYGREHRIDWTPTLGAAYTMEYGDLTLKTLASYGRATRAPDPNNRLAVVRNLPDGPDYTPPIYVSQYANPFLTPEYERGPQGGIELYYGNRGSLTINHYQQTVTDLILPIKVDSIFITSLITGEVLCCENVTQYVNLATMVQKGWEGTATLNIGPLNLKGVYSWNDSRIRSLSPHYTSTNIAGPLDPLRGYRLGYSYTVGAPFDNVPTHTGSIAVTYAWAGTSVTLISNWIGSTTRVGNENPYVSLQVSERLRMYSDYYRQASINFTKPGYVKTDLAASERLTAWASATLNVTNLNNSFQGEGSILYPTIGRQTQLGLSLRFPRR